MINRLPIFTLPVLVILLLGSGCATLSPGGTELPEAPASGAPGQPMILVEMQSPEKGGSEVKIPLSAAPTLQAAVEQSKAARKFKRFHIAISRLPHHSAPAPQKLVSKYDHVAKRVPFEYDYSLQAGDRVVIVEDKTSTLDDVFGTIVAPLRSMGGQPPASKSPF